MRSQDYEELNSLVKGLLKMGYIHESMSPCVVPLTPKTDGSWRAINWIMVRYTCLDDELNMLIGLTIFSKIDLCSG